MPDTLSPQEFEQLLPELDGAERAEAIEFWKQEAEIEFGQDESILAELDRVSSVLSDKWVSDVGFFRAKTNAVQRGINNVQSGIAVNNFFGRRGGSVSALREAELQFDELPDDLSLDEFDRRLAAHDAFVDNVQKEIETDALGVTGFIQDNLKDNAGLELSQSEKDFQNLEFGDFITSKPGRIFDWALNVFAESAPISFATIGAGVAGGPAAGGAVAFGAEFATSLINEVQIEAQKRGVDIGDPVAFSKILNDPAVIKRAQNIGAARGLAIGIIDTVSGVSDTIPASARSAFRAFSAAGVRGSVVSNP